MKNQALLQIIVGHVFFLTTAKSSSEDTWFYTFVKIKPNTSIAANDADKSCDVESLAVLMILSQP